MFKTLFILLLCILCFSACITPVLVAPPVKAKYGSMVEVIEASIPVSIEWNSEFVFTCLDNKKCIDSEAHSPFECDRFTKIKVTPGHHTISALAFYRVSGDRLVSGSEGCIYRYIFTFNAETGHSYILRSNINDHTRTIWNRHIVRTILHHRLPQRLKTSDALM